MRTPAKVAGRTQQPSWTITNSLLIGMSTSTPRTACDPLLAARDSHTTKDSGVFPAKVLIHA